MPHPLVAGSPRSCSLRALRDRAPLCCFLLLLVGCQTAGFALPRDPAVEVTLEDLQSGKEIGLIVEGNPRYPPDQPVPRSLKWVSAEAMDELLENLEDNGFTARARSIPPGQAGDPMHEIRRIVIRSGDKAYAYSLRRGPTPADVETYTAYKDPIYNLFQQTLSFRMSTSIDADHFERLQEELQQSNQRKLQADPRR